MMSNVLSSLIMQFSCKQGSRGIDKIMHDLYTLALWLSGLQIPIQILLLLRKFESIFAPVNAKK